MSEQQEAWSPPRDWRGNIEIEVRAADEREALVLIDATRDDWNGVQAALAEAAQRHAYWKAARERAARRPQTARPMRTARGTAAVEPDDEPEPGHTGPSTGHS